jgi:outer membrane immunogenic protein
VGFGPAGAAGFGAMPLRPVTTLSGDVIGLILGGQLGVNWQVGSVVLGIEADLQATGGRKSNTTSFLTEEFRQSGLATFRGRVGWAFADGWLAYATAGGAVLGAKESFTISGGPNSSFGIGHGGWTAGAGVEAAINRNWSWKVEYLYAQTGQYTTNVNFFGATVPWNAQLEENVVRAGVNYRF